VQLLKTLTLSVKTVRGSLTIPLEKIIASLPIAPKRRMNDKKLSSLQLLTLILCFLVVAADGFDVASVGYVAPLLRDEWTLDPAQLGLIFGAGLFGLCIGSFLFGPMADRIGRKRVIMISLTLFGIGSFACAYAPSPQWLTFIRFITGVGLGGALPAAITLTSEFSPTRNRAFFVTLMLSGFPLGLAFGGVIAALLMPCFGWKGVFILGGVFPLCLVPIVGLWLPESLKFMAGKPRYVEETRQVLLRLRGNADSLHDDLPPNNLGRSMAQKTPAGILFSAYYRAGTFLLWLCFFCTLWVFYQLSSWLPTAITDAGIDVSRAALIAMLLPLGGALGGVLNGFLMDRMNPFFVLTGSYLVAAISTALIGVSINEPKWIYVTVFMAGFGLSGAQCGANVIAAEFYVTAARATGVSWASAVGRIGSIIGAMTGGLVLTSLNSVGMTFVIFAVPTVIAGGAMLATSLIYQSKSLNN
jgi:MFS transporter, AAHS family, 4-hydroxybenzoate transporter